MQHSNKIQLKLSDESDTIKLAKRLAETCVSLMPKQEKPLMISLAGNLGAGKSFFARAFIQCFLPEQRVKSPTYTLVESYQTKEFKIQHFDLYRLCDPEELEFLAIRDLLAPPAIVLVEWASKGEGVMPDYDLVIHLTRDENTENTQQRNLEIEILSAQLSAKDFDI